MIVTLSCSTREPPVAAKHAAPSVRTKEPESATVRAPVPRVEQSYERKPGWGPVSREDELPICVFADAAAQLRATSVEHITKQTLRAKAKLTLGMYPDWCVNEACDQVPSLQCSVERVGASLIVHSKYWGDRRLGSSCEEMVCRPVAASCETPELEAGVYRLVYGSNSLELRLPGRLRNPCLGGTPRGRVFRNGASPD